MSQGLTFPPELVEAVVEQIDADKSLQAFSLVCRGFAGTCQRRLFHTLALHIDLAPDSFFSPSLKTFKRALCLFNSSPHLVLYVRELAMTMYPSNHIERADAVGDVLDLLRGLEKFTIEGCAGFCWFQISAEIFPPLWRLIQRPSLRSFSLSKIADIPCALLHYAAVSFSQLSINFTSFDIHNQYQQFRHSPDPPFLSDDTFRQGASSVEHITILSLWEEADMDEIMLRDGMQCALRNLRRLDLRVANYGLDGTRFLRNSAFSSTLTYLGLDWWSSAPAPHTITLPFLPALQTLALRIDFNLAGAEGPSHWTQMIESALADVDVPASSPILEWLHIVICGGGLRPVGAPKTPTWPTPAPWPPFDTPHYAQSLARLREVRCRLENGAHQFSLDTFVGYMEAIFPGPREAGILSFESSGYRDI